MPVPKISRAELLACIAAGMTDGAIAAKFHMKPQSVYTRRHYWGLQGAYPPGHAPKRASRITDEQIRAGVAAGMTDRQIGAQYGIGATGIHKRRRRLGIPTARPKGGQRKVSVERDELMRRLAGEGQTARVIGQAIGVAASTVINRCREMDIKLQYHARVKAEAKRRPRISAIDKRRPERPDPELVFAIVIGRRRFDDAAVQREARLRGRSPDQQSLSPSNMGWAA